MKIKKSLVIAVAISAVVSSATTIGAFALYDNNGAETVKGSGGCPLSVVQEFSEKGYYDVYSPVGESTVKLITQAPRLSTLNGKTIAIVGGSFMASVTHPEIKRLILKNYPSAKVLVLSEIGSAGPYPAPGVRRQQKDEFEKKLKELHVDAVISGNGGCGLCTPKEEGSCLTAEHIGIPSVMIAAPGFVDQAKATALIAGVPVQRVAEYPGAFASHTREELIKNTQDILWPQIVEGLTKPISNQEISDAQKSLRNDGDSIVFSGNLSEVQNFFENQGWTDGLPITPPILDKINEFLKYTPYSKDSVIGNIPPSYRKVTAFQVAAVGVMAGCPPEYMPILVAYTKAMMNGDFRKTLSSTHAWTPFVWINGPIARQLGIDYEQGEISAPNNKKIGRFIDLAMINLGGYDVKKNRMGTFGYLSSWAMAEDEQATVKIGWQPYHVQKGFNINDNALTAASSLNWGNNLTPATSNADKILELMAWDAVEKEQFAVGGGTPFVYRTIFITEYVARDLAKKYTSKQALENALIQTARRPLDERTYANYWANPGSSFEGKNYSLEQHKAKIKQEEKGQITSIPKWLSWTGKTQIETVPVMTSGKTSIVVTGDANRNKVLTVPGGGFATVKIELPNNWDDLMKELGYQPLNSFYLKTGSITPVSTVSPTPQKTAPANAQRPQSTSQNAQRSQGSSQNYSQNRPSSSQGQTKRPSAEQYRKMMQEKQSSGSAQRSSQTTGSSAQAQQKRQQYVQSQKRGQGQRRSGYSN